MKAVALISGGKDSCFNALHCVANGHQIVALANLHPPADQGDELDSHMYQTVGHNVIPLYAQCFFHPESTAIDAPPLPMFRRAISGTSASIGISYDNAADRQSSEGAAQEALDEVEDLFELLSEVKRAIPDVQGVSVGAILSTYQRVRVEHVCQRLGLTVLAYLWQQDQVALLDSMVRAGMNSVLIKVAAMGLNGRHLGRSLAQLQPHLLKMHADFDLHPCGEGGEYETLTLDCPLFRRRLVLHQPTVVEHSPDEMAPVLFYSFDHVTVEDKDPSELPCSYDALRELIAPSLCDPLIQVPAISGASEPEPITNNLRILPSSSTTTAESNPVVKQVGPLLTFSAIRPRGNPDSLESAVDSVMQQATSLAAQHGLSIARDAIFATVLVRNMSDFARVNAVYGKYFGINPAAR
ncbi:hypothetical protein BCR44DRAFT_117674 [Catenaria anguillulae PL171]|uniref:Diphthine--ammonia ligase n=1 Tax=Catenaria anguillulae PL171 TaxID=765915 RepID=A0A1Y2HAR0_9FUNG|nr:hypothetical protein BCR44DRAFT_117674 [Catenaria anguillulae PL171]